MPSWTIATFNIRHGRGLDDRVALERVADAIRSTDAGLVALQEVDVVRARSGSVDQPAELRRLLDMNVSFFPTISYEDGAYGMALATRGEIDARFVALPRLAREEPRGALVTLWEGINVLATHLSTDRDARGAQMAALSAMVASLRPPVVVLGDLNEGRRGLRTLEAAGFTRVRPRQSPRPRLRRRIDHILIGDGLKARWCREVPSDASDHAPLVARISL